MIITGTPEEFKELIESKSFKSLKKEKMSQIDLVDIVEDIRKITMKSGIAAEEMRGYVHYGKK